jgi:hypothetical protein
MFSETSSTMTDVPGNISRYPEESHVNENDSGSHASADQWTLTEQHPLISPGKLSGDEETEWDVKSAVERVEEYTRCVFDFALPQGQD